jgi:hypothetical protein
MPTRLFVSFVHFCRKRRLPLGGKLSALSLSHPQA